MSNLPNNPKPNYYEKSRTEAFGRASSVGEKTLNELVGIVKENREVIRSLEKKDER